MHGSTPIAVRMAGDTQLIVVRGVVERDGAREIDYLVRHRASDSPAALVIDLPRPRRSPAR